MTLSKTASRNLRIVNTLFWLGIWAGVVTFTGSYERWLFVAIQGFVPAMLWVMLHLALRPGGPES